MNKKRPTGSFVALITPFNKDGSVDFAAFASLLECMNDAKQHGYLPPGHNEPASPRRPSQF